MFSSRSQKWISTFQKLFKIWTVINSSTLIKGLDIQQAEAVIIGPLDIS